MNKYFIQQKIKTTAQLYEPFIFRGFEFVPFNSRSFDERDAATFYDWSGDLVVRKEVSEENGSRAGLSFSRDVSPIIDALSVISQTAFSTVACSILIQKVNNNPEKIFYIYLARDIDVVGMPVGQDYIPDLEKLLQLEKESALWFLREANNATTCSMRLAMQVIAVEALAGSSLVQGKCSSCKEALVCSSCGRRSEYGGTDKAMLKKIYGEDLYRQLYMKEGGGLRHRMFHGSALSENEAIAMGEQIHLNLVRYFTETVGLKSMVPVGGVPRAAGYESGKFFVRPKKNLTENDIRILEPKLFALVETHRQSNDEFEILFAPPSDY